MDRIPRALRALSFVCVAATASARAHTQTQTAAQISAPHVAGVVTDQTGSAIPHATIHLHNDDADRDVAADAAGRFTVSAPEGTYLLTVEAPGFAGYSKSDFTMTNTAPAVPLKITLQIATAVQEVNVGDAARPSTDSAANGDALVFSGNKLDTFSDDPSTMNQQLLALAGGDPSNPPQLFIDGFSNGTLPPKASIREIRINQNPFSAQYDQPGYGRVEVLTKPGAGELNGEVDLQVGNSALNARNPYSTGPQPSYSSNYLNANINGPLGRGKNKASSFFLSASRSVQASNAIVNAVTLDNATLLPATVSEAVPNPNSGQSYSARFDHQFGTSDTLIAKYSYNGSSQTNAGVGQLALPTQGYNNTTHAQTLQLTDTHLFGAHVVLDAGLQYIRTHTRQDAISSAPSLVVQGSFSDGGNYAQSLHDNSDRIELQQYLSIVHGKHFIHTGLRYRLLREANLSSAGYNGQFLFPSLVAYQITRQDLAQHMTDMQIRADCRTQTDGTSVCGGATQFTLASGTSTASLITGDLGAYAEDEWKATGNLTLNYGFRIETQSAIPDHFDFAPRVGAAYQVMRGTKAKSPFLVLRGGFGLFYRRFPSENILQSLRQNGVSQQTFIVTNPATYPSFPTALTAVPSTIYEVNPHLRSPYAMFGSFTVERSLGKYGNFSVNTYLRRSVHLFESLNINAPLPGTYNPGVANSGIRPFGGTQNIYQYSSDGLGLARNINANLNLRFGQKLGAWANARFGHTNADVPGGFASNSYNVRQDYGPPGSFTPRQVFAGLYSNLPHGISISTFVSFWSHSYFNITTGQDNNGDSIYNDRPSFATDLSRASVVRTAYGNFDTQPIAGQTIIPANYGNAPGLAYTEIYVNKGFHFGPRLPAPANATPLKPVEKPSKPPDPRYEITFGIGADNLLNHTNPGTPVGVLTSPFFGQSISLNTPFNSGSAANRQLLLRTSFSF